MPAIKRAASEKELEALRNLFLKAETDIINEIGRLRSLGNVDYHAVAALERIQAILTQLSCDCFQYVPKMIEKQFYVSYPQARKIPEAVEKHARAYANAAVLTSTQHAVIDILVSQLMGEIDEAGETVLSTLENALIGRQKNDIFRRTALNLSAHASALGGKVNIHQFVNTLLQEGITAFVDKAGRRWSLYTYGMMACRTTNRQAEVLAVLTADPDQDLYQISSHKTTCALCAPYEGRVYSRSGKDPDFPPLAAAFGKIDPKGPEDLTNSYLNIHPNCLHVITAWTPAGRDQEELQKIKDFSSFTKNPPSKDPRTQREIEAYRQKERARAHWLRDYRQWERYRIVLGDDVPKTFQTFQKHKRLGDEKYKNWLKNYKKRFYLQNRLDYTIGNEESFIPTGALFETVKTIAGNGSKTVFRHAQDYAGSFGGQAADWSKKVGKIESAKYIFDVHWVERDGVQYDAKVKNRKEK